MIRPLREAFNASWTEQQYLALLAELQQRTAGSIDFPIAETPCFFPRALVDDLARTGEELIHQAITGEAGSNRLSWTWRELADEVLAAAYGLRSIGLRRGDRMLIAMSSRPEHWAIDFAAVHLGAIPCSTYAVGVVENR